MKPEKQIKIKRAKPEDAEEIAGIFQVLYSPEHGYTKPEVVKKDIENPHILPFVALEEDEIIGHGQLRHPEYEFSHYENNGVEIARLGVRSKHQNKGVGKRIVSALNDIASVNNHGYIFADFNTVTDYSQRAMKVIGLKPAALLIGYSPDFAKINQANSFLLGMKITEETDGFVVYLPQEHKKLADLVYESLGLKREIRKKASADLDISKFEEGLERYLQLSKKVIKEKRHNPNHVFINLSYPSAVDQIRSAKSKGLVVQGLVPLVRHEDGKRYDVLVMGYIPHINLNSITTSPGQNQRFSEIIMEGMYK
jgi:GNAT superfamily N-acetyltransferase